MRAHTCACSWVPSAPIQRVDWSVACCFWDAHWARNAIGTCTHDWTRTCTPTRAHTYAQNHAHNANAHEEWHNTHTRTHTHAQHKLPSCVKQSHGSIACAPRRAKPAVAALRPQHTHCVPGAPTNTHAPRSRSSRLRGPARTASNARHNASGPLRSHRAVRARLLVTSACAHGRRLTRHGGTARARACCCCGR